MSLQLALQLGLDRAILLAQALDCFCRFGQILDQDERTILQASETMELLHYGLPDLTGLSASDHTSGVMQAAE